MDLYLRRVNFILLLENAHRKYVLLLSDFEANTLLEEFYRRMNAGGKESMSGVRATLLSYTFLREKKGSSMAVCLSNGVPVLLCL